MVAAIGARWCSASTHIRPEQLLGRPAAPAEEGTELLKTVALAGRLAACNWALRGALCRASGALRPLRPRRRPLGRTRPPMRSAACRWRMLGERRRSGLSTGSLLHPAPLVIAFFNNVTVSTPNVGCRCSSSSAAEAAADAFSDGRTFKAYGHDNRVFDLAFHPASSSLLVSASGAACAALPCHCNDGRIW